MSPGTASEPSSTVLDLLCEAVEAAAEYNRNDLVAPAVILWTDKECQWKPVLPLLRDRLPELLALGEYLPAERTGPAIWLKCVLGGAIPEVPLPEGSVPILYLPGVSRAELRAVEECPRALQPLAELQYRGVFFSHRNGRDWTVRGFLEAKLGLDVAGDEATSKAIRLSLPKLVETAVGSLAGHKLEAVDFLELMEPDLVKSVLGWMNDPQGVKLSWSSERFRGFIVRCREKFHFDPERDGEIGAASQLGGRQGPWES